jgi:ADP-ribosylglycohydrolase
MFGAIVGDIAGSRFEHEPIKTKEFEFITRACSVTDDTVLTIAVADHLLNGTNLVDLFHTYFDWYPQAGYGGRFVEWAFRQEREPYNSWGNGSAMRVGPVGWAFNTIEETLQVAEAVSSITHNHPEGVRGAQAVAAAVFFARQGLTLDQLRCELERRFGYDLSTPLAAIRPDYAFDVSCQGSVPQSIRAALEASDFVDAVRNAISLGGDADTMACIAGGIAEAHFGGVPPDIRQRAWTECSPHMQGIITQFVSRFSIPWPNVG